MCCRTASTGRRSRTAFPSCCSRRRCRSLQPSPPLPRITRRRWKRRTRVPGRPTRPWCVKSINGCLPCTVTMARRILSADSALMPQPQLSLKVAPPPVTITAPSTQVMQELTQRWNGSATGLFDWGDRSALMAEIDLVNRAQGVLDEAATKIAPSVLRIVLTVKEHLPDPKAQRAFLGEHLQ